MASAALDIRLRVDFWDHHKTKKLQRRAGECAPIYLQVLWCWCRGARPSGDLSGLDDEDIEIQAKWPGEPGLFVASIIAVGFLDGEEGMRQLHDWEEEQPWARAAASRSESARNAARSKWDRRRDAERCDVDAGASKSDAESMRAHRSASTKRCSETETETETETPPLQDRDQDQDLSETKTKTGGVGGSEPPPSADQDPPDVSSKILGVSRDFVLEVVSLAESLGIPVGKDRGYQVRPQVLEAVARVAKERAEHRTLDWWRHELFGPVKANEFLMREFRAPLLWICGPKNRAKILGGFYRPSAPAAPPGMSPLVAHNVEVTKRWLEKGGSSDEGK